MGNPTHGSQAMGAPGGTRGVNQTLVIVFERDESLAASLLGQFRAQGYECRSARTPVEVFDDIAHSPVALVLVNLGHPTTTRREFWVALDGQRRGRGVQVITYRVVVPGVEPDSPDGSGRGALADVEIRGAQGFGALIEAVRLQLSAPRQPPGSSFLLGSKPLAREMNGQSSPAPFPGRSGPPMEPVPEYGARPQIAGVLNMSAGVPPGQLPEFVPLSGSSGGSVSTPVNRAWPPDPTALLFTSVGQPVPGAPNQRGQQWPGGYPEPPGALSDGSLPGRSGAPLRSEPPGNSGTNGAGGLAGQPAAPPEMESFRQPALSPAMPMGELSALSDAIHALAAAGAPGYRSAAAAVSAMNAASMSVDPMNPSSIPASTMNAAKMSDGPMNAARMAASAGNLAGTPGNPMSAASLSGTPMNATQMNMASHPVNMASLPTNAMNAANQPGGEASYWSGEQRYPAQDMPSPGGRGAPGASMFAPPSEMSAEAPPSGQMGGSMPMGNGSQSPARGAAETIYMSHQAFGDMRPPPDTSQDTRSRSLSASIEEYGSPRRERTTPAWSRIDEPTPLDARRASVGMASAPAGDGATAYQRQMLSPVVAPGRVERSLSNVLIEGQLVSQQRLEVTLGIQRLLRGVDIDYRLGELLLMFKFLTSDQLLAALLVSRGMVTPAQVASMGRIKQELQAIGMEYDLENLLILFRLLGSEQLREIRSEFP